MIWYISEKIYITQIFSCIVYIYIGQSSFLTHTHIDTHTHIYKETERKKRTRVNGGDGVDGKVRRIHVISFLHLCCHADICGILLLVKNKITCPAHARQIKQERRPWCCGCAKRSGGYEDDFPRCVNFPDYSHLLQYSLPVRRHFHIVHMFPQLNCGDICWKWMWL